MHRLLWVPLLAAFLGSPAAAVGPDLDYDIEVVTENYFRTALYMSPSGRYVAWLEPPAIRLHDAWTGETIDVPGPPMDLDAPPHQAHLHLDDGQMIWRRTTASTSDFSEIYRYDLATAELTEIHPISGVNDNPIVLDAWLVWRGWIEGEGVDPESRLLAYRFKDQHLAVVSPGPVSAVRAAGVRVAWTDGFEPVPGGVGATNIHVTDLETGETRLLENGVDRVVPEGFQGHTIVWIRSGGGFAPSHLHVASPRPRACGQGAELALIAPPIAFFARRRRRVERDVDG